MALSSQAIPRSFHLDPMLELCSSFFSLLSQSTIQLDAESEGHKGEEPYFPLQGHEEESLQKSPPIRCEEVASSSSS